MIWIILLVVFVVYVALAYVGLRRRRDEEAAEAVVEATIDSESITKRRADGLVETITWAEVVKIQVVHRTTDLSRATETVAGFTGNRHLPVDDPTLLVFHGDDSGAVLPAWPDVVESMLIQMRHHCSMGTQELGRVRERLEIVERGVYEVWSRPA